MTLQNRPAKRASLGVESLEGRRVLSTSASVGLIAHLPGVPAISYLDVLGSAHGSSTMVVGSPDVGTTVKLQGSGVVSGLGSMKISGSLHGTGLIAKGQVEGSITLSNTKGSFTMQLQSPTVGGFTAPKSGTYTFYSTSGTGDFKKDFGNGSVVLALRSNSFTVTFDGKPSVY